jgi:hypothetical protein
LSKLLGNRLPEEVVKTFNGNDLANKIGLAYLMVTTDADGTPRPCMLSPGEVFCPNDSVLRVALWPGTNTSGNLERGSRALFCYVAPKTVLYVKGLARKLDAAPTTKLDRFEVQVESVESDNHPGMPIAESMRFDVVPDDRDLVVRSWERQVDSLRA